MDAAACSKVEKSISGAWRASPGRGARGSDPQRILFRCPTAFPGAQFLTQLISTEVKVIMAFCVQCGSQLPDTGRFCTNCGASVNAASGSSGANTAAIIPPTVHQPLDYTIQGDNL